MKMNKAFRVLTLVLSVLMVSLSAFGCSKPEPADEKEVLSAARTLIEEAVEVNRIFFWEGLPHVEADDSDGIDMGEAEYIELTDEYKYLSEEDLISKAENVYTKTFCDSIKNVAFEGVKLSEDEVLFARYIVEMGVMKINRDLSEEGLPERIPDLDTIKAVEILHDSATVSLEFTCDGKTEEQTISLKLEENGWRLDTPTY